VLVRVDPVIALDRGLVECDIAVGSGDVGGEMGVYEGEVRRVGWVEGVVGQGGDLAAVLRRGVHEDWLVGSYATNNYYEAY